MKSCIEKIAVGDTLVISNYCYKISRVKGNQLYYYDKSLIVTDVRFATKDWLAEIEKSLKFKMKIIKAKK